MSMMNVSMIMAAVVGIGSITPASVRRAQPVPQSDVACNEPALPDSFFSRGEVLLRVSVTDDDHNPMACLTREDFTITEDGRPQTITSFLDLDVPLTVGLVGCGNLARSLLPLLQAPSPRVRIPVTASVRG